MSPEIVVRRETALDGTTQDHRFYDGYDLWGYDENGVYCASRDHAPFRKSPFPTADED